MFSPMLVKAATYLDSNAGAPLSPCVAGALLPFLKAHSHFIANPSSSHSHGRFAKRLLFKAREQIASSFSSQTHPEQILFTSSGTEANQLVIRSVLGPLLGNLHKKPHWITTGVEHDSVRQLISWFEGLGGKVSYLPVNEEGGIQTSSLSSLITPETALISVLWVNNETGVITDVPKLIQARDQAGNEGKFIPLHLDAAQAWGKFPLELESLGAQFVTFSAHKIGGLAGSGAVWVPQGSWIEAPHLAASPTSQFRPQLRAMILGHQEKRRRGGTENLLGAIAMGVAASQLDPASWSTSVGILRDRLETLILDQIPGTRINGSGEPRVANTMNLSFMGLGEGLGKGSSSGIVMALDLAGYSVSSGSACASGAPEPSHVLLAMGRSRSQASSSVRVSIPGVLPWEVLDGFVHALIHVLGRFKSEGNHD